MFFFSFLFIVLVSFFFIFNCFVCNIVVWWSVFLLITLVFVFLGKVFNSSFSSLLNYFIIQEFLGLVFLIFNFWIFQFFVILIKVGVSPFHFWIFSVVLDVNGFLVLWFLTFQKLPFIPVIFYFFDFFSFYILVFGIVFCYFQIFLVKSYKGMLLISSTESFNWFIILGCFSFLSSFIMFFYYVFFLCFFLFYSGLKDFDFFSWEFIFVFINIPIGIVFFVKIFSLFSSFLFSSFLFLFVLFFIFLSVLCFCFWILNFRTKFYFFGLGSYGFYSFLFFCLFFFCLI